MDAISVISCVVSALALLLSISHAALDWYMRSRRIRILDASAYRASVSDPPMHHYTLVLTLRNPSSRELCIEGLVLPDLVDYNHPGERRKECWHSYSVFPADSISGLLHTGKVPPQALLWPCSPLVCTLPAGGEARIAFCFRTSGTSSVLQAHLRALSHLQEFLQSTSGNRRTRFEDHALSRENTLRKSAYPIHSARLLLSGRSQSVSFSARAIS